MVFSFNVSKLSERGSIVHHKEEAKGRKTATTGIRFGFAWDLALILHINVGVQGEQGLRILHTLVVFHGISTVRFATKSFWTGVIA